MAACLSQHLDSLRRQRKRGCGAHGSAWGPGDDFSVSSVGHRGGPTRRCLENALTLLTPSSASPLHPLLDVVS